MALYYAKGTISQMSEVETGVSKTSGKTWKRMTIIIDIPGYQGSVQKMSFRVGTDKVDAVASFLVGDRVEIGFSIYALEYNGRYYNNMDLVSIAYQDSATAQTAPVHQGKVNSAKAAPSAQSKVAAPTDDGSDDLPF